MLASYGSGFEADLAMAQLEAADIPAIRDNNDTVGLFGAGSEGPSGRGTIVRVPADYLEVARETVGLPRHQLALVGAAPADDPAQRPRRAAILALILGLILFAAVTISMIGRQG